MVSLFWAPDLSTGYNKNSRSDNQGGKHVKSRLLLHGWSVVALGAAGWIAGAGPALAQKYPDKSIKLVSPYAAGGATDTIARLIDQWISDKLGASVVVENKPGGGANIGTESVLRSSPDGYNLLLASTANAVNATLFANLKFKFIDDVALIGNIGNAFNIPLVHPSFPSKTTAEFIAHLKANPGKVSVGLHGNGSPQHLSAELSTSRAAIATIAGAQRTSGQTQSRARSHHGRADYVTA